MISRQRWLRSALLVTVLLGVWTEETRGEIRIQLTPQYPEIGGSVTLTVTGITGSIKAISWYKGPASSDGYQILFFLPGSPPKQVPGPLFHNRMVPSSGSLRISNLNRADEGQYRVQVQADRQEDASVHLTVYDSTDSIPQSPIPVAIIGSVIAVVVLLILLVALIYVFIKRRKGQKDNSSAKGGTSRNGQANASATPEEPPEIQYADIVIKRMPRKQEQQPPPESVYANRAAATKPPDDNVVYSELRI